MLATTNTCNLDGSDSALVKVEAEILRGFSAFFIVGLAGQAIRESKERIRAAMMACQQEIPLGRIIVNLYPADQHKSGSHWDLPIALSLLVASGHLPVQSIRNLGILGELGLDGTCMPVPDAFALVLGLARQGIKEIMIPADNLPSCQQIEGVRLYPVHRLEECILHFQGKQKIPAVMGHFRPVGKQRPSLQVSGSDGLLDYGEMSGQEELKRVMTAAAAGHHSLLLIGPPGLGKTMACDRFAGILPDLTAEEAIESASIRSLSGLPVDPAAMTRPSVRKPNYTITSAGFYGGGLPPKPGEISLAQNGVLIMDEFPLFAQDIINPLRFSMENRYIELSRGNRIWRYPADYQLIASMNPCPCGYHKDPFHACTCTPHQISRYLRKIPQPVLDRFDIIYALKASYEYGEGSTKGEEQANHALLQPVMHGKTSAKMREEVLKARAIQKRRYKGTSCRWNGEYDLTHDPTLFQISPQSEAFYMKMARKWSLSRRAFFRLLKLARTLADLGASSSIQPAHIMEAFHYYQARYSYWPL